MFFTAENTRLVKVDQALRRVGFEGKIHSHRRVFGSKSVSTPGSSLSPHLKMTFTGGGGKEGVPVPGAETDFCSPIWTKLFGPSQIRLLARIAFGLNKS